MELDESHRRELFDSLETALGPRPAATLMAHLPPVGWADVATKHDLYELERRLDHRFEVVDNRLDGLDHRLDRVDHRLDGMDHRLDRMDARLDGMDTRLGGMDARLSDLAVGLRQEMNRQTMALLFGLGSITVTMGGVIVAALHFSSA